MANSLRGNHGGEAGGDFEDNQVTSIAFLSSEDIAKLSDVEDHDDGIIARSYELSKSQNQTNASHRDDSEPVYTVEDAINVMGFGPFQILVTLFAGMIWMTDAMELMLLSVLSPIVTCDWKLEDYQEALITSVVFVGIFLGGLFWGIAADAIGRKKCLLLSSLGVLIFGLASAAAPEYYTLLLFRCMAGFALGGAAQAVTYYVEFLPKKLRGVCIVLLELWWAIGSVFAALLALAVIPNIPDPIDIPNEYYRNINWRIYLVLCALPVVFVLVFFIFIPESARYCIASGRSEKGQRVIARIARMNFKSPPPGRLVSQEEKEKLEADTTKSSDNSLESSDIESDVDHEQTTPLLTSSVSKYSAVQEDYKDKDEHGIKKKINDLVARIMKDLSLLFVGGMWKSSILILLLWLGCAWLYYGAVLLTTTILEAGYDPHCGGNQSLENITDLCQNLTTDFYVNIVWTTTAEFPGIIITLIIIEIIGRKKTISIEFFGSAVFFGVLLICVPEVWLTVFLFGARGFVTGVFQAVYVYTPEVFPTKIRGIAMGVMTSTARIGAFVTPFVAQALYPVSDIATIALYGGSAVILSVLTLLLPIETKGRSLTDTKG